MKKVKKNGKNSKNKSKYKGKNNNEKNLIDCENYTIFSYKKCHVFMQKIT